MGHRKSYYTKLFDFNIFLDYNFDLICIWHPCNALALKKGDHSNSVFALFVVIFLDKILKKESIIRTFIK